MKVKTQFSWRWFYYTVSDKGIEYLREYLHLPPEIVPATFKRTARPGPDKGMIHLLKNNSFKPFGCEL